MNSDHIWDVVKRISNLSECLDRKVACVIYHKGLDQIVGKGFNIHLNGICDCDTKSTAQHAELTALNDMMGPFRKEDLVAYINHRPCCDCSSALSKVVEEVRYKDQKS